nr:uncharacterized protein LOC128694449 [Cherax quadricarinatus]
MLSSGDSGHVGSRHNPGYYRPSLYNHQPRPRPGHHQFPVASVIDKDPLYNIYSRPGVLKKPYHNMTRVLNIDAECQDDFMRIHVQFNGSFSGLIYSLGYAYDGDCIYVNGSGRLVYDFFIQLNRCGTLSGNEKGREDIRGRTPSKNMMWNTLTVQYNPLIEEVWDEHFKVTCEYGYDFWKTVTFPFLDVEVQTGNPVVFTLTPPECHMEIRYGIGTTGKRVTGPVRVGDPLTLVIYMRSEFEGFDIVVSDCYAHNGGNKRIALIDHYGCPLDESLISHFEGTRTSEGLYETQVYAFMKTFRFTGSPALYIECDVRMCHGDCPLCKVVGLKFLIKAGPSSYITPRHNDICASHRRQPSLQPKIESYSPSLRTPKEIIAGRECRSRKKNQGWLHSTALTKRTSLHLHGLPSRWLLEPLHTVLGA